MRKELIELLKLRGYNTEAEVAEYLSPKPQKTYDPFLLHNMREGVDLVMSAIDNDEMICIYGDYDADGITATSIMLEVLSYFTKNLSYYIPSRFDEGYGLNKEAIRKIHEAGADLIITVDCGSVSYDEVEYAKELGLKIIVTDHHLAEGRIADCILINPNQPDCTYPFKGLAGCAVAFKFAQALVKELGGESSIYNDTLDLVTLGTVGDLVPLIDENRTLVKYGLKYINAGKRANLKKYIEAMGMVLGNVTASELAFKIVPPINAAGRIRDARLGVRLFRARADEVDSIIARLKEYNDIRKDLQSKVFQMAEAIIEESEEEPIICIYIQDAHEGVTGIAAGRLKEKYKKPAIIMTDSEDGLYKGTARSVPGLDLHKLLSSAEAYFERFGGHKMACGFSILPENVQAMKNSLAEELQKMMMDDPDIARERIVWDLEIPISGLDLSILDELKAFEPCGKENEEPLFYIEGRVEKLFAIGKEGKFRRFNLADSNDRKVSCISFLDSEEAQSIRDNSFVRVIGKIQENIWNGQRYLQMVCNHIELK